MRIVFWQNCLSPHQLPYIVRLLDDNRVDEVVIVAGTSISSDRKSMGWELPHYNGIEKCQVHVMPNDKLIGSILSIRQEDSWHLFSGIRADAFVFHCIKMSMDLTLRRGIITELPCTYDFKRNIENAKPLWMHRIRFRLQDYKYAKHMKAVFAMGTAAVNYFKSINKHWDVFNFSYCTEPSIQQVSVNGKTRFLFVGSLSIRKNPIAIINAYNEMKSKELLGNIEFIGNGDLRKLLDEKIENEHLQDKITALGKKSQTDIPHYLAKTDVLILPSLHDGWGAVVNEALQAGCYTIVSDDCGAKTLLEEDSRLGLIFNHKNTAELSRCMDYVVSNIDKIRRDRDYREKWADAHISGRVLAKYMVDCLYSVK